MTLLEVALLCRMLELGQTPQEWLPDQVVAVRDSLAVRQLQLLDNQCVKGSLTQTSYLTGFPQTAQYEVINVFSQGFVGEHLNGLNFGNSSAYSGFGWGRLAILEEGEFQGVWSIHFRRGIERVSQENSRSQYERILGSLGCFSLRFVAGGVDLAKWRDLRPITEEIGNSAVVMPFFSQLEGLPGASDAADWILLYAGTSGLATKFILWKLNGDRAGSWALFIRDEEGLWLDLTFLVENSPGHFLPTGYERISGFLQQPFSRSLYKNVSYTPVTDPEEVLGLWGTAPEPVPIRLTIAGLIVNRGIIDQGRVIWYEPVLSPRAGNAVWRLSFAVVTAGCVLLVFSLARALRRNSKKRAE